jgi:hypothetical protein
MSVQAPDRHVRRENPPPEPQTDLAEVGETTHSAEPEVPPRLAGLPTVTSVENLWNIARDALKINPPLWVSSILGLPWTRLPPFQRYSEFRIIDLWQPLRSLKYLLDVGVPAIPRNPPEILPPVLDTFFYQPSVILQRPDHYGSYTSYPREKWFFINGIMTNDDVAQLNAAYLSDLFHRPITLVQNSTCGLVSDLAECALGKQWRRTTEAVKKAFPAIHAALRSEKEKVVIIAHSQGTIIASVVLQLLEAITQPAPALPERAAFAVPLRYAEPIFVFPEEYELDPKDFATLTEDELAKLEMYCFANCANTLKYLQPDRAMPWIESFGNEFDIVARLGMLAPRAPEWHIEIDGPRYVHRRAWGHLLNEHYLPDIERQQKVRHRPGGKGGSAPYELLNAEQFPDHTPKLFNYINGGT